MNERPPKLKISYYCTGHGLGHATRVIEIARHLLNAGHDVTINTGAPLEFFRQQLPHPALSLRSLLLDSGAFQLDAFTVDMKKSLEEYHRVAGVDRAAKLAAEAAWLREEGIHLVVSDVVPLACAAAAAAGVPSVCVSNFSWDFVYSEYLATMGTRFRPVIFQIAEDYSKADLLLRLPGYCPMPAFREVIDVPLVARIAQKPPSQVRAELGIAEGTKVVVFMYGGHTPGKWRLHADSLPPGWTCIVCSNGKLPDGQPLPPNFILADKDAFTPDLIGAADCLLGKIGYGAVSESLAHGKPFVFVRRDYFNEEPFLRKTLEIHGLAVEIKRRDFLAGNWQAFLQRAVNLKSTYREAVNGAEVVAELLEDVAYEKLQGEGLQLGRQNSLALERTRSSRGISRLRDTVLYGYIMQRHALQKTVEIPEWYSRGHLPSGEPPPDPAKPPPAPPNEEPLHFSVLEGRAEVLGQCEDSLAFLELLGGLHGRPGGKGSASEVPERRAARGLFRFDDDIWVSRAPGRLDVMGGISDYSGSLVLQMPIAQACHVAAQVHPPGARLQLWQHIRHRQESAGAATAVLRIVSLHAGDTNRGHAFDMDLSDLLQDGRPLPYADARDYFKSDPSQSWAAYVAGALLVLMHEEGCTFDRGLSLLISSQVPDGKGVSSSAALEVASMMAITAAHGIGLTPARLAALCQKVENLVVGAPCGLMDQMASVMGDMDSLMALRCQPAQVMPSVAISPGLKFWGVDSGVRHSVGGQDYGSVRAAAFMGLKIISRLAQQQALQEGKNDREPPPIGQGYLTNIPPSEYRQFYEERLPDTLPGSEFLQSYGPHWDAVTEVQDEVEYPIAQATQHPVMENFRVQSYRQALLSQDPTAPSILGELMFQSHASYSRCGLGSEATDRLVALTRKEMAEARAQGRACALHGAKITGGGSGGTVCILGTNDSEGEAALRRVVADYSRETGGFEPTVLVGSSMGAAAFGCLRIRIKSAGLEPTQSGVDV